MSLVDMWSLAMTFFAGASSRDLARRPALCSARVTLRWTGLLPVQADLTAEGIPEKSYGCTFDSGTVSIDVFGVPQIALRWLLDKPAPVVNRSVLTGGEADKAANPIVGIIAIPTVPAGSKSDDALSLVLVIQNILPAGQISVVEAHGLVVMGGP